MIKFNFKDVTFEVKEVDGLYDLNDLRKQALVEQQKRGSIDFLIKSKFQVSDWTRSLDQKSKDVYNILAKRGRGATTLANKQGLISYTSWLDDDFRRSLEAAFVAIAEGRDEDARSIVGSSMIDMEMVEKVNERWKKYISWSYKTFSLVNKIYGANMVRMVLESSLGVSAKASIKGKSNDAVIPRLVEQGHGDAILALNATLGLVSRTLKTGVFNEMSKTREGQKMIYKYLKEMLSWEDEM